MSMKAINALRVRSNEQMPQSHFTLAKRMLVLKLSVIWILAVATQGVLFEGNNQLEYQSIMYGGLFGAIATILLGVGLAGEIKSHQYWIAVNIAWACCINVYIWLLPFVPDLLPNWVWFGVAALTLVSIRTIQGLGSLVKRIPETQG